MAPNFTWPQVWPSDLATDHQLPGGLLGTLELVYAKDLHAIVMRNADLKPLQGRLAAPDGRPFFGGCGFTTAGGCPFSGGPSSSELTPDGAGIYVIDNTSKGHSINVTAELL